MKHLFLFLFALPALWAQNSQRQLLDIELAAPFARVQLNDGWYEFVWLDTHTVQAQYQPNKTAQHPPTHAVTAHPKNTPLDLIRWGNEYRIQPAPSGIEVRLQTQPFAVAYYLNGELLTRETEGFTSQNEGFTLDFNLQPSEQLFGGGARVLGTNYRGKKLALYNKAHYSYGQHSELMNFCMPLVISNQQYLLHFDNTHTGHLDLGHTQNDQLRFAPTGGAMRYQIIVAKHYKELTQRYTALTGLQPLPPRWMLGNFASRFGYHSQRETEAVVAAFKKQRIPLDAVILDLYWFGKDIQGTMGNLDVYRDSFPRFEEMTRHFKNQHIQTIAISEPFITTTSSKWEEAAAQNILAKNSQGDAYTFDFFFGHAGLVDLFKPEAAKWFWKLYQHQLDLGISGFWGDLGEPEKHPDDMVHAVGSAKTVHNIYGHFWAKLIAEGYALNRKERPFILMRAGYSGSQQFGMIPWSGDVSRSWDGLKAQPLLALQMGLQGMGYYHSDLGGFAGTTRDSELYTRWLQYGVFNPVFRPHAHEEVPAEPIFWDAPTREIAKKAIELRYRLLPYNYTLAYQNTTYGYPLMRPRNWDTSLDVPTADAYLWGDHLYVAPVLEKGQQHMQIEFPNGTWLDWYTGQAYSHNATIELNADYIPTFVKAGALIPQVTGLQTTAAYQLNGLQWHLYYDAAMQNEKGEFFYDDGISVATLPSQNYHYTQWLTQLTANTLALTFQGNGLEKVSDNAVEQTLVLHHLPKKVNVYVNEKPVPSTRNAAGEHWVKLRYENNLKIKIVW